MSATRLLVLGVVRGYGRAHGYLIGSDLLAWGADRWANVKWGSIYHALKQLTSSGALVELDRPARTEYAITDKGEQEFRTLLREAISTPGHRPDMLGAGLVLLPALTRQEATTLLEQRLSALEPDRDTAQPGTARGPEHVRELRALWQQSAQSDAEWTRGLLSRLRAGDYAMAGEPGSTGEPGSWPVHD